MAVSKRLRFEILRRDDHRCRYCGRSAPEVVLTVDHVVAVALGGSDDPSNLVAACRDCNGGKSATPVDAAQVAQVTEDAFRWAAAMRSAFDRAVADLDRQAAYVDEFLDAWNAWHYGADEARKVPMPGDWERSVTKWFGLGVPIEILRAAVRTAMRKRGLRGEYPEFAYMAGVIWRGLEETQRQVAAQLAAPQSDRVALTPDDHCDHDSCAATAECYGCGKVGCLWACGYEEGDYQRFNSDMTRYGYEIYQMRLLRDVIDFGTAEPVF